LKEFVQRRAFTLRRRVSDSANDLRTQRALRDATSSDNRLAVFGRSQNLSYPREIDAHLPGGIILIELLWDANGKMAAFRLKSEDRAHRIRVVCVNHSLYIELSDDHVPNTFQAFGHIKPPESATDLIHDLRDFTRFLAWRTRNGR
jgi:hypothetical protein